MITFIFKAVTLIFFMSAELESKKIWSKFDIVTHTLERNIFSCYMTFIPFDITT